MLARRLPTVLPAMSLAEALETTKIHSVAGVLHAGESLVAVRPFRAPHHTISDAGLIGGGSYPRPGEVSLAHGGVLFLRRAAGVPQERARGAAPADGDGSVTLSRAITTLTFPARFMLAAAMNPCPCGFHGDTHRPCVCTPATVQHYLSRSPGRCSTASTSTWKFPRCASAS